MLEKFIQDGFECAHLDFKAIQYRKERYDSFLVDVVAMANAQTSKPKYIVIGVKAETDGSKEFLGIDEPFVDEATFQQLVMENIEPDIKLEFFPFQHNDVTLGIFHISECENPPYMLKKDYGKLKRGDGFIRKGSHQTRITRKDIDAFFQLATEKKKRIDDIQIRCLISDIAAESISPIENPEFPSENAAEKIKRILNQKKELAARNSNFYVDMDFPQIGGTPYEKRSIKTLEQNLKDVKETYQEDDIYCLLEECSYKLNFELLNLGKVYLEDASIEVTINKDDGLIIPERIPNKPDRESWIYKINRPYNISNFSNIDYPTVKRGEAQIKIFDTIGDLKHLIATKAFKTPIRLVISGKFPKPSLVFNVKIYGKSFEKPMEKHIELLVEKKS